MLVILGYSLGLIRIAIAVFIGIPDPTELWFQMFKDMAHIYMGFLLRASILEHRPVFTLNPRKWAPSPYWKLFWGLNVVETAVAILSRIL